MTAIRRLTPQLRSPMPSRRRACRGPGSSSWRARIRCQAQRSQRLGSVPIVRQLGVHPWLAWYPCKAPKRAQGLTQVLCSKSPCSSVLKASSSSAPAKGNGTRWSPMPAVRSALKLKYSAWGPKQRVLCGAKRSLHEEAPQADIVLLRSRSEVFTNLTLVFSVGFPQALQTTIMGITDRYQSAAC